MKSIPITKPYLGEEEYLAVKECLDSGWLVQGPQVEGFEKEWAAFTDSPAVKACTSCTTALHLALLAVGVKPGDEVIVPAFTWIATASAVEYCGARPVFVDVSPDTFNIDIGKIEAAITPKTTCLLPVHLFGLSADMDPIMQLAESHDLQVVEDCACALGTYYKGKHAGTFGAAGCFSLHPRKSITTGEGGMITLRSGEHERLISILRSHGAEISDRDRHESNAHVLPSFKHLGFNYRMTDLQAALGRVQLSRAEEIISRRIEKAEIYNRELSGLDEIQIPFKYEDYIHSYQSYILFIKSGLDRRNHIANSLHEQGIATRQGTHVVPFLDYYKKKYDIEPNQFTGSLKSEQQSLCIPLYPQMTEDEQSYVISVISRAISCS